MNANDASGKQQKLSFTRGQLLFSLFILIPYFIEFVLPVIFYRGPISVGYGKTLVSTADLWWQLDVASIWFLIVFLVLILPFRRDYVFKRCWPQKLICPSIFLLTILGSLAFLANAFFVLPAAVQQIVFPFSLLPAVSIALVIFFVKYCAEQISQKKMMLWLLLLFNALLVFLLPLVANSLSFLLADFIAILYACCVMKVSFKKIVVAIIMLGLLAAVGQSTKLWIRSHWYHGQIIEKTDLNQKKYISLQSSREKQLKKNHFFNYQNYQNYKRQYHVRNLPFESRGWFLPEDYALLELINRLGSQGLHFAVVLDKTPKVLPYWHGSSYTEIPKMLLPRALWPSKPVDNESQYFGHLYGFSPPKNHYTAYAIGGPIEAWLNGGWWGIVLTALAYGLILRFIWMYFVGNSLMAGNIVLAMVVVLNAGRLESDALMVLGNLLHVLIIYWILEVLIRRYFLQIMSLFN